jgi:NAD(P)-dependent dehydrogenase (short-subunit alcohol dehydrogenase family)
MTLGSLAVGAALLTHALRGRRAMDFTGRTALITGGSRGLGLLIARELGRLGARVVLVARDAEALARAQEDLRSRAVDASTIVADITSESDARRIVNETVERFGRLDILVNNAGVIKVGPLEHMTVEDFEEAMATHFWGPLHAMRAAVPHMRQSGGGRIVNISSIGGKLAVPHLAPYCASKFALMGVSSAFRAELAQDGILVTTVSPGLMRTGSPFNAWFKGQHRQEFAWFTIADSLPWISVDGRRAAASIVDALRHGDAERVVSWPARIAVFASALAPNAVAMATGLTNRVLPGVADDGDRSHSGWQSASPWAPSVLTRSSERSAAENNELPLALSLEPSA